MLLLSSCDTDDTPYSYLSQPDANAEIVRLDVDVANAGETLETVLQASEMYIDWGDGSKPQEYVLDGKIPIDSVKLPVKHVFAQSGKYRVTIYASNLRGVGLSGKQSNENDTPVISAVELANCYNLVRLSVTQLPLALLDVTSCPKLTTLKVGSCTNLSDINLGENFELKTIELKQNTSLQAAALNTLFGLLPLVSDDDCVITLQNNAGDATCNPSIATAKGWKVLFK